MTNKIDQNAYHLASIAANKSTLNAIDQAMSSLKSDIPQPAEDTISLSEDAQRMLTLKPIEKLQLDHGAAPNELADIIYLRDAGTP